ncbi:MAG: DUF2283 domain-containing protein [Anaerolineae bacterium]
MHPNPEADFVFETVDYSNTPVILSRATWRAKAGNDEPGEHPEIRDYLEDVQVTIEKPDLVFQSTRDPRSRLFYRLSVGRGRFAGKHLVVVVICGRANWRARVYKHHVLEPNGLCERRAVMAENGDFRNLIRVHYDREGDILTFSFTPEPQPAVAEEAADEIWVRYDPDTHQVVTVDILNFSARVRTAFGPRLTYTERADPQRLESLEPLRALQGGGEQSPS